MNIDTLPAGREMDALVAEKVMGWKITSRGRRMTFPVGGIEKEISGFRGRQDCLFHMKSMCPAYSTSISAAWEVVEHFRNRQWKIQVIGHEWYDGGLWECVLLDALNDERGRAFDRQVHGGKSGWPEPSAPLAICRAALKAVEET